MKRELLKKISKAMAVVLVIGMFVSGTPSVKAEDSEPKDIATNTDYYIGETIIFGPAIMYIENGKNYAVTLNQPQLVTRGLFTPATEPGKEAEWIVNIGVSLCFYNKDFTGHEIIKGVRCISGDGTAGKPYTFSLLYEDPVTVSIEVINGTRKLKEEVYPNTETYYIAAHDDVELVNMYANEGYKNRLFLITEKNILMVRAVLGLI